eukprot:766803-Hanusia_phi.AAC.2
MTRPEANPLQVRARSLRLNILQELKKFNKDGERLVIEASTGPRRKSYRCRYQLPMSSSPAIRVNPLLLLLLLLLLLQRD